MKKIIITAAIFLLLWHSALFAQTPGSLDLSFDTDGKVTTDFSGSNEHGNSIAIQLDGKIVVAGYTDNGSNVVFALCRYNNDGSLDTNFDSDGKLVTDFGSGFAGGNSVAIQSDNKIVVAGTSSNGADLDIALVRYNINGSLDITFDLDGKLTTDFGGTDDYGNVMVLQPNGKIIVAGASVNVTPFYIILARYNTDGSLDTTFDTDGTVITDFGGNDESALSVILQPDGKIIVAGFSGTFSANDFTIVRYNSDGSLDNTFDSDGKVTTDFASGDDYGESVYLQPDGKLIVAGITYNGVNSDFALARYNDDGSLDATFDGDGKLTTDFLTAGGDWGESLILQPDGKIILAGGSSGDFAIACYKSDGSLDTTFSGDGKLTTDFGGSDELGAYAMLQPDGKIVVAGYSGNGTSADFALARYISGLNLGVVNFSLDNNSVLIYPNPVAQDSKLEYILTTPEEISISLMDVSGKMIKTFVNCEKQEAGAHSQMLNFPSELAPGNYYIIISTPNGKVSVKIIK